MATSPRQEQTGHSEGRGERFHTVVSPEIEVLYRVAHTITENRSDAEGLVEKTMAQAYATIDQVDEDHPRAWLLATMRTASAERSVSAQNSESSTTSQPSPVTSELASLPDKSRKIVELVDLDKLSYREAASVLGISVRALKTRLHRARSTMVANLDPASFAI